MPVMSWLSGFAESVLGAGGQMTADVEKPMSDLGRRAIGCYLVGFGLLLLIVVPWAWSVGWRANESENGQTPASFLGLDFTASAPAMLLTTVVLMAVIGSITVMTLVFAARAGHGTLEQTYVWWYVTRPVSAAGLGVLVYMFIVAAVFDFATIEDGSTPALVVAAAVGALSGLFTDQVLDRVRRVLGLSPFDTGTARRDKVRGDDIGLDLLDEAQVDDEPMLDDTTMDRLSVDNAVPDPMDRPMADAPDRSTADDAVDETTAADNEATAADNETTRRIG
jgi:hypothetical protein